MPERRNVNACLTQIQCPTSRHKTGRRGTDLYRGFNEEGSAWIVEEYTSGSACNSATHLQGAQVPIGRLVLQEPSGQARLFRWSTVSTSPAVQHIGHPRKANSAQAAGIKLHQPRLEPYNSTMAKNPKPTTPRMK
jgi:hypothetical protein